MNLLFSLPPQCFLSLWPLWTTFNIFSHRGDSPDFGRQRLLEAPLQVLHVGRLWPGDEGRAPLLRGSTGSGVVGGGRRWLLGELATQPVESRVHLAVVLAG